MTGAEAGAGAGMGVGAGGSGAGGSGTGGTGGARPGDVARRALYAARAGAADAESVDEGAAEPAAGNAVSSEAPSEDIGSGTEAGGDLAGRPGDVAREALRAARAGAGVGVGGGVSGTAGPVRRPVQGRKRAATPPPAPSGPRTDDAAPPPPPAGESFATTWWGHAWVRALEEGAMDGARLARGRAYAGQGHVAAISVTPGRVLAYVHGSRPRPYRAQIRLRTLGDDEWERFLDAAAERPGHIAALLDKDMPHSLADCGVDLLPGPGDLDPQCGCPDSGRPCKHAAALCYQTARLLDEDPFVLFLMRGRDEKALLDALSRRNAALTARAAREAQAQAPAPFPGVRARDAFAERTMPPLPPPLRVPPHPEQPPAHPAAPGGPDPFALDQLATDAAARAHALLTAGRDPVAGLTLWQDAVRLAAARPGSGLTATTRSLYAALADATGRDTADLSRAVAAWRQGGAEGLSVLEEPWDPPAGRFDRARPALLAADLPAFRPWRNHLTHPKAHVQLRLGRDGLWYAYESEPGQDNWWPRGVPDLDPVGALTTLGTDPPPSTPQPH
ncbi:SWIM zinc finger family protein [Streptomyces sp. NPDC091292]|uniref:SWIM zinc finger family protein n=1 Tax=Streptomyces sp. NPDC091292 TaxID=3365991 RepID=UPI0037F4B243